MENKTQTKTAIIELIEKIAPGRSAALFALLNAHLELMFEENKKYNLTGIKNYDEALEKHLLDSVKAVSLSLHYFKSSNRIVEPGSGGGFPGIPIAILFPEKSVSLIESIGKKARFLELVKKELKLENLRILQKRTEEIARDKDKREKYDLVISRALASLPVLVELTVPLLKTGAVSIALKGKSAFKEIQESRKALELMKAEVAETIPYSLITPMDLMLVIVRKLDKTPDEYPRDIGIPQNEPLV